MSQVTSSRVLLLGVENADGSVTGVTTGQSVPLNRELDGVIVIVLRSVGTTSGGTVLIEEADWGPFEPVYSGLWSQVASVSASAFSGTAQSFQHIIDSAFGWVRVRISSAITGGGTIMASTRSRGAM